MVKSDKAERIGIFGGTFNPIHHGHLINIELLLEHFNLDHVLFIPDRIPVHKNVAGKVTPADRLKMVELAITGSEKFSSSGIEINRESASYTITTLHELEEIYPGDELFLIIGSDSFNELDTWKDYKSILSGYKIIVMMRPGDTELREDLLTHALKVERYSGALIEISSSMIRERVKNNLPVRYLTTDNVIEFIRIKGLYKIGQ
ncbi:MAG: nicotinate (nicotinamide) nucleotide adenylyltransferase [Spirochaetae bacterium HGW-Spirochaetae-5]|nr:MAG: nicotinate (nicotinamide) nucleotide adenylyltransferase [Spirochaetae bacterium HGW-Spirochaetae-5]